HRFRNRIQCHHCGFSTPIPKVCPGCQDQETLVPCGPGVERVAEEVRELFPEAVLAILSSDTIPNIDVLRETLRTITEGEADIIVGTQLVAKGHNFPNLTLVGVVDGDLGLGQADPRASERTYQLLNQVTGRAGRVATEGRGLIQTHIPEHPVMQALISGDRDQFLAQEIRQRQQSGMPPFGRLASLIVSSKIKDDAATHARMLAQKAPSASKIVVLGPAEAPISVIRGRHRFRILVKAPRDTDIQGYLTSWLDRVDRTKGDVRLIIDIDPYNFL
ncbi:MAG: replication restart helicase PriA, partial [Desulfobulbia bacterium]